MFVKTNVSLYKTLIISSETYCIYQICKENFHLIDWAQLSFFSFTKTENEFSVLTLAGCINNAKKNDSGWRRLHIKESIPFQIFGVLNSVLSPLAKMKISVLVISTFDTDYIFFQEKDVDLLIKVLESSGFTLIFI